MVSILFLIALITFLIGAPMAVALGLAAVSYILLSDMAPNIILQRLFAGVDITAFLAIPFFILAGNLMLTGGLAHRLIRFANSMVGSLSGGLAIVTILGCMFFASISGSALATAAVLGTILIPAMVKHGYDTRFATAVVGSASPIGVIIPPSVTFIIYGSSTNTSIKDLYMAGLPAGIILGVVLAIVAYIMARRYGYVGEQKPFDIKEFWASFKDAIWALGTPIIMVGGVFGGLFTPTESAVIAVLYALVIGLFVYKELKLKDLIPIFFDSAKTTGSLMFIVANAALFAYVMTIENIPQTVVQSMLSITENPILLLLIINIILLAAGAIMETIAIIIVMVPLFMPVVEMIGMDPVVFGVIVVVNTAIGMVTPPFGLTLLTASSVAKIGMEQTLKQVTPFILASILVLLLITYFPDVVTIFLD
jgi:C4-dicarboxylate transporter DctM subunit